jgi:diguanylate cyclase (GGDEF)-like protein
MAPNPSRLRSYRQSVARRLFYTHLWVGLVLAFGVALYFYFAAERALDGAFRDRFHDAATSFALSLPMELAAPGAPSEPLDRWLKDAFKRTDLLQSGRLYQFDELGQARVLASVGSAPEVPLPGSSELSIRGEVRPVAETRGSTSSAALIGLGDAGWLYLQGSQSSKESYLADLRLHALIAFIAAVLLSAIMAALLSRDTRRVLKRFAQRCQEIAEGRFEGERSGSSDNPTLTEFGDFADALEGMAARLARLDAERSKALDEARAATARLESNVRERTAELDRLNSVLRKEIEQRCQLEAVLAEAAATDTLTRLLNRRGMVELLEQLAARTHQQRRHFCVAIADIDYFKSINDRHGHAVGDRVLAAVAARLRADLKGEETASRWGGEEFLLVWPELPLAAAEQRANRLRLALSATPLFDGAPTVTLSFGLVEYSGLDPLDACLIRADKALYRAKERGRDRVEVN